MLKNVSFFNVVFVFFGAFRKNTDIRTVFKKNNLITINVYEKIDEFEIMGGSRSIMGRNEFLFGQ